MLLIIRGLMLCEKYALLIEIIIAFLAVHFLEMFLLLIRHLGMMQEALTQATMQARFSDMYWPWPTRQDGQTEAIGYVGQATRMCSKHCDVCAKSLVTCAIIVMTLTGELGWTYKVDVCNSVC